MVVHSLERNWKGTLLALLFVAPIGGLAGAEEVAVGSLTVIPLGLENSRGKVFAQLMRDEAEFDGDARGFRDAEVKVVDAQAVVVFSDLPHGDYALKLFHDENDNRKLDTNFVGMPKEKFGFSNDAMGRFGPPSFEQARFRFEAPEQTLRIKMK
jgi:uncharacterized protein (DUF2141 family)